MPLEAGNGESDFDFLPQYGMVLDFSRDGRQVAAVKFNPNFSRSLYVVDIFGEHRELLTINGSIIAGQFDPKGEFLYAILTRIEGEGHYREVPYLALFDLKTKELFKLKDFDPQQELYLSLAPDGRTLAVDAVEGREMPDVVDNSDLYSETAPVNPSPSDLAELPTDPQAPPATASTAPSTASNLAFPPRIKSR